MDKKIAEIKQAIKTFQNDTTFRQLRTRWEGDLKLYRLKTYNAGQGYLSYTSNAPRLIADKVTSALCDAKLLIRFPEELLTDEEARLANNSERLIYGGLTINDDLLTKIPDTPPLREQLAWYATVRGSVAFRVYVYKNDKGKTVAEVIPWDIYNVSFEKDDEGIVWAAYTYKATKAQAEHQFGFKTEKQTVTIVDYWGREQYGVIIDETWHQPLKDHGLKHCPVYIIRVGATPVVTQDDDTQTPTYAGESVFAPNRGLFPIMNKTISDLLTIVRRGVKVPLGYWSADGSKNIEEDIWQVEKAASIPMMIGEEIKPIMTPTMPPDAAGLVNLVSGEVQRGGFPHTAFGELGFRLSGYAVNQLQAAVAWVITPFVRCLEQSYYRISREIISQYGGKSLPPIEVQGRTSKNQPFGYPIAAQIKPSEVRDDWYPEVQLLPNLPKDDAARYSLAQIAREGDVPLLSDETIRGELIGVQDPALEDEKIDRQWADKLIVNRLWKAYVAALREGDQMAAQNILGEVRRLMMGQAQGGARPVPRTATPTQVEALGMGTTTPPQTGMPPTMMPFEAGGGMPPGARNARMPTVATEEA